MGLAEHGQGRLRSIPTVILGVGLGLACTPAWASSPLLAVEERPPCTTTNLQTWWQRWHQGYLPAGAELRRCGSLAVPGLQNTLQDAHVSPTMRGLTARILAQIGTPEAIAILLAATSDETLQAPIRAAVRLLDTDDPMVIVLLRDALTHEDWATATTAAIALGHLGTAETLGILLAACLTDSHRPAAVVGLEAIHPQSATAVDTLTAALRAEDEILPVGAAYGLAHLGPSAEKAIPALVEQLQRSPSPEVRMMSAYALGEINPGNEQALQALLRQLTIVDEEESVTTAIIEALNNLAPDDVDRLIQNTVNLNPELSRVLRSTLNFDLAQELIILVQDRNQPLDNRLEAAATLGHLDSQIQTIPQIFSEIIRNENEPLSLRRQSAVSLGTMANENSRLEIQALLIEMNYWELLGYYETELSSGGMLQPEDSLVTDLLLSLFRIEVEKSYEIDVCLYHPTECQYDMTQITPFNDPLAWIALRYPTLYSEFIIIVGGWSGADTAQLAAGVRAYQSSHRPVICQSRWLGRWIWRCRT